MTVAELRGACLALQWNGGERLTLVGRRPNAPGFPRGELLCVNSQGERVYSYPITKLLAWCDRAEVAPA